MSKYTNKPSVEEFWIGNVSIKIYWCRLLTGDNEEIITICEHLQKEDDVTDVFKLDPGMLRLLASGIEEVRKKLFIEGYRVGNYEPV